MPRTLVPAAVTCMLLVTLTAACDGAGSDRGAGGTTLVYWASNQGPSLDKDREILRPELAKFTRQTGINVDLQVIGWPDLYDRILTATKSGQGPDVVNIGNTWSPSLQATGALLPFDEKNLQTVGGKRRFLLGSLSATGAAGKDPAAVPLYSLAYGLYYNKKLFAAAGIAEPPTTWEELIADGKKLTGHGRWGLGLEGGDIYENAHHAFTFSQQYGGQFFDSAGRPTFDAPGNVEGVQRYLDFMAVDKIVAPSNAGYQRTRTLTDFARGKTAMIMWQAADKTLRAQGMSADDYDVVPVPFPAAPPANGERINSMVAGVNLAVFKNTEHKDAALKFVEFMTSDSEQVTLNKTYGTLPSVSTAYLDDAFQTETAVTLQGVLVNTAAPLPAVPEEAQFETLVGTVMRNLFEDIARGRDVSTADVRRALAAAGKQVKPGG